MRKPLRLLLVAAMAAGVLVTSPGAQADHCQSDILVFSRTSVEYSDTRVAYNAVNHHAALCIADPSHEFWDGFLAPGANELRVRWTGPITADDFGDFRVVLDGLGFDNHELELLEDQNIQTGDTEYQTAFVAIPDGPTAQGEVTITVIEPGEEEWTTEVTYHTLGN